MILAVRETPLHPGHLRLMQQAAEAGAFIFPPVPVFYAGRLTLDKLVTDLAGRILLRKGIENNAYSHCKGTRPSDPLGDERKKRTANLGGSQTVLAFLFFLFPHKILLEKKEDQQGQQDRGQEGNSSGEDAGDVHPNGGDTVQGTGNRGQHQEANTHMDQVLGIEEQDRGRDPQHHQDQGQPGSRIREQAGDDCYEQTEKE